MDKFNVEAQFQFYLTLVGLAKVKLPEDQLSELRKVFFGAFGQFLVIMQELAELDEFEAFNILDKIEMQIDDFWKQQVAEYRSNG